MDKIAYTLPEVAEMTGLSLRSLQDGCRTHPPRVPHRRHGRQRVMTQADLDRFLAQIEVAAVEAVDPEVEQLAEWREKVRARLNRKQGRTA